MAEAAVDAEIDGGLEEPDRTVAEQDIRAVTMPTGESADTTERDHTLVDQGLQLDTPLAQGRRWLRPRPGRRIARIDRGAGIAQRVARPRGPAEHRTSPVFAEQDR